MADGSFTMMSGALTRSDAEVLPPEAYTMLHKLMGRTEHKPFQASIPQLAAMVGCGRDKAREASDLLLSLECVERSGPGNAAPFWRVLPAGVLALDSRRKAVAAEPVRSTESSLLNPVDRNGSTDSSNPVYGIQQPGLLNPVDPPIYKERASSPSSVPDLTQEQQQPGAPARVAQGVPEEPKGEPVVKAAEDPPAPEQPSPPREPKVDPLDAAARDVYAYWVAVMGKTGAAAKPESTSSGKTRLAKVKARLRENPDVQRLKTAIDGCKRSPHHQGKNDTGTVYDDLDLICRNDGKVDAFVKLATAKYTKNPQLPFASRIVEAWAPAVEEQKRAAAAADPEDDVHIPEWM